MLQLVFVLGCHHGQVGDKTEKGYIKHSMMGRPIITHHPGPIQGKGHWQVWQADIVDQLIQGTLHKTGIDSQHWPQTVQGKTSSKGHGMLLRDSHVKKTIRETQTEL